MLQRFGCRGWKLAEVWYTLAHTVFWNKESNDEAINNDVVGRGAGLVGWLRAH